MKFRAFRDNVFLLLEQAKRETAGGIALPDSAINSEFGDKMLAGKVISAGPGGEDEDGNHWGVEVSKGDRVLVGFEAGQDCVIGEHIPARYAPDLPLDRDWETS